MSITSQFQSTLPVWGGTGQYFGGRPVFHGFNPPSPCGEGRACGCGFCGLPMFQSTLPVWGGTGCVLCAPGGGRCFNPPSPCGEGRVWPDLVAHGVVFQSTLPVWGGTSPGRQQASMIVVSIHPPRVGRDFPRDRRRHLSLRFNPPSPCGEGLNLQKDLYRLG